MAKLRPSQRCRITKLFKAGKELPEIRQGFKDDGFTVTTSQMKSVLRQHFIKLCDNLWSHAVKLKAGNICIIDQKPCNLNSHHLIGRSNYKYRWDVINGVSLGIYRHTMANDLCAHGSTSATQAFASKMATNFTTQWVWFQEHRYDTEKIKVDVYYLLETAQRLEKYIENLKEYTKPDILARKKVTDGIP